MTEVCQYDVPDSFDTQAADWNNLANPNPIKQALMAVIRPDGKIGLAFSEDGARLFAVRLTDLGKILFDRTNRYVAVDNNEQFIQGYNVELNLVLDPPPTGCDKRSTTRPSGSRGVYLLF